MKIEEYLKRIPKKESVKAAVSRALLTIAVRAEGAAKDRFGQGGSPRVRTGRLRSSINHFYDPKSLESGIRAGGGNLSYARIQEYGGKITPKRSRFLTIPLPAAQTAAGVSRYPSARQVPGLFFLALRGKHFLAQKHGSKLVFWYILKSEARIPARPYLGPAADSVRPQLAGLVFEQLKQVFGKK